MYDGKHIVLTFDGNGNLTHRYLYGLGIDQIIADQTQIESRYAILNIKDNETPQNKYLKFGQNLKKTI